MEKITEEDIHKITIGTKHTSRTGNVIRPAKDVFEVENVPDYIKCTLTERHDGWVHSLKQTANSRFLGKRSLNPQIVVRATKEEALEELKYSLLRYFRLR